MSRTPKTRERLMDAALDLFAEQGFEGTTITEVERRVGLAPGTGSFYRHFPSKEELLRAAVEREVEQAMAEVAAARADPAEDDDPIRRDARHLAVALAALRRFDRLFRLVLTEGERVPGLRDTVLAAVQGPGDRVTWEDSPRTVVRLAALAGYHVFSTLQGRPFQGAPEDEFLAALAAFTADR
jgi:AcrR family transcriptional regulator